MPYCLEETDFYSPRRQLDSTFVCFSENLLVKRHHFIPIYVGLASIHKKTWHSNATKASVVFCSCSRLSPDCFFYRRAVAYSKKQQSPGEATEMVQNGEPKLRKVNLSLINFSVEVPCVAWNVIAFFSKAHLYFGQVLYRRDTYVYPQVYYYEFVNVLYLYHPYTWL